MLVAKVSVRDALLKDLQKRYPDNFLSTSDRILKAITELDALRAIVGVSGESIHESQSFELDEEGEVSVALLESLASSVQTEEMPE